MMPTGTGTCILGLVVMWIVRGATAIATVCSTLFTPAATDAIAASKQRARQPRRKPANKPAAKAPPATYALTSAPIPHQHA